jgi:hypothetical protein
VGARHAEHDGAVAADDLDGVVGLGACGGSELFEVTLDAVDEPTDPGDLVVGWCGLGARPFVDVSGGA